MGLLELLLWTALSQLRWELQTKFRTINVWNYVKIAKFAFVGRQIGSKFGANDYDLQKKRLKTYFEMMIQKFAQMWAVIGKNDIPCLDNMHYWSSIFLLAN